MPSKHFNAKDGDYASTVLMPGDPLRAQYIAERHLKNARRVNDVRAMYGFTGEYRGRPISIQAHGIGIPSASLYVHELLAEFEVKRVIRVGSCGSVLPTVKLNDIVVGMGASTDSGVNRMRLRGYDLAALASFRLLRECARVAEAKKIPIQIGNIFSADLFYTPEPELFEVMKKYNILGVEMEAAGIYTLAAEFGAEALAICTVSDEIYSGRALTTDERQTSFDKMIELALETALLDLT